MRAAESLIVHTRRKRVLEAEVRETKETIERLSSQVLEGIENGMIPESFRLDGAKVFTRTDTWASPADGDHDTLASVLGELGLVEYLPKTVNSQSISAFVREHINDEGEIEGLDPLLVAALRITRTPKVVVNL